MLASRGEGVRAAARAEHDQSAAGVVGEEIGVRRLPGVLQGGLRGTVLETPLVGVARSPFPLPSSPFDDPPQVVEDAGNLPHELGAAGRRGLPGGEIPLDGREARARGLEGDRERMFGTGVEIVDGLAADAMERQAGLRPSGWRLSIA